MLCVSPKAAPAGHSFQRCPAFLLPFCCRRTPLVGSRCGQRSAASSLPFCCRRTPLVSFLFLSAASASAGSEAFVAGRSLWTASALKAMRSGYLSTLGLISSGAVGVVVSHPLSMQEGLGSILGLSMPMCACVCHSLPLPSLSSLWVCCASCQDRLVRRGRVPNVTFESYIESRKLSVPRARPARTASRPARLEAALASPQRARTKGVRRQPAPPLESYRSPGRDQQEQLRVQRAWRPHLLRRSEHEPKECAGSLLRRGRVPNVAFEWPLFAVGKRARPGKALKHLHGTVFSAEALSRPARPAFLFPFCCRRTPLVGSRCGQRSASSLPFCCRRTPPAGPSALKAMRSRYLSTLGLLSSGAVGVVVSHPLSMREGLGSIPGLSMPMCACVCHSLPLPGLSSLWVCCASCQDRLVRRGRVPNVTFESYIESRKLSVPRARPARTASRPARLEAALASPQRARTKGVRRQPAPPLESYRSPGRD